MTNWFFIRGLVREKEHWGHFPSQFSSTFPNTRVHCLEIPGNGELRHLKTPTSISAIAEAVRSQYLETLKNYPSDENYILSISMGAMIALEWLSKHSEDVTGCVFINTSVRGLSPFYKRLRPSTYPRILKALFHKKVEAREKIIVSLTSNNPAVFEKTYESWSRIQTLRPVSKSNAMRQLLAAALYRPPVISSFPPTLVLNSSGDRLVSSQCSLALTHLLKDTTLRTHPNAGHDIPLDDPEWVIHSIGTWIESLADAREEQDYRRAIETEKKLFSRI